MLMLASLQTSEQQSLISTCFAVWRTWWLHFVKAGLRSTVKSRREVFPFTLLGQSSSIQRGGSGATCVRLAQEGVPEVVQEVLHHLLRCILVFLLLQQYCGHSALPKGIAFHYWEVSTCFSLLTNIYTWLSQTWEKLMILYNKTMIELPSVN